MSQKTAKDRSCTNFQAKQEGRKIQATAGPFRHITALRISNLPLTKRCSVVVEESPHLMWSLCAEAITFKGEAFVSIKSNVFIEPSSPMAIKVLPEAENRT